MKGVTQYVEHQIFFSTFAKAAAFFFSAVLCVSANSASSCIFYQPKMPKTLSKFSKVK